MKQKASKILKNKNFWIISLVLLLLWIFSLIRFFNFSDKNYVGEIVQYSSGSIIVDDGKIGEVEIYYNEATPILSRHESSHIEVSIPVFVRAIKNPQGELEAEFIRILPEKR